MSYYKFEKNDLFTNTVRANPRFEFFIHSCSVYIDNAAQTTGPTTTTNVNSVEKGYVSLYEYNVNRSSNYIHPFIIKGQTRQSFKRLPGFGVEGSEDQYNTNYQLGDTITSNYRMSASVTRYYHAPTSSAALTVLVNALDIQNFNVGPGRDRVKKEVTVMHRDRPYLAAIKNTLGHNAYSSQHYQFSSSYGDKATQELNLISIPSILYGSKIDKGSVSLKYYITGTLAGELSDYRRNGELVQIGPEGSVGSGSIAGVVLYTEGLVVLTGSWSLDSNSLAYDNTDTSQWVYFGYGMNDGNAPALTNLSASFLLSYSGSTDTQTMTMFAKAPYNDLNFTNNPTIVEKSGSTVITGSTRIIELPKTIKNTADHPYKDGYTEYDQSIYISKINLYDEDKNLIGIAKLAKPIRKTKNREFAFKLKLDI